MIVATTPKKNAAKIDRNGTCPTRIATPDRSTACSRRCEPGRSAIDRSAHSTSASSPSDRRGSSCVAGAVRWGSRRCLICDFRRRVDPAMPANATSRAASAITTAAATGLCASRAGMRPRPASPPGTATRLDVRDAPAMSVRLRRSPGRAFVKYEICQVRSSSRWSFSYVIASCVASPARNAFPPVERASVLSVRMSARDPAAIA